MKLHCSSCTGDADPVSAPMPLIASVRAVRSVLVPSSRSKSYTEIGCGSIIAKYTAPPSSIAALSVKEQLTAITAVCSAPATPAMTVEKAAAARAPPIRAVLPAKRTESRRTAEDTLTIAPP
jgi:hypothetical protein